VGVVPGHEIMGTIQALGKDVPADSGLSVGDQVIIFPWRGCRNCAVCEVTENVKGNVQE
jgi:propanol-preferring alcohol dehydrogenase